MTEISASQASGRESRRQGRPRQSDREVGRDKVLERTRAAMNVRPRTDIQRREIADAIGVTPALITYYFPDKWSLLEEAASPIITGHIKEVERLLGSGLSTEEKFRNLIRTYLKFNREHGYMLEYFVSSAINLNKPENIEMLAESHGRIIAFFQEGVLSGVFKGMNAELIQSMLWGICQYLGRIPESQYMPIRSPAERQDLDEAHQNIIFDLFQGGVLQSASFPSQAGGFEVAGE